LGERGGDADQLGFWDEQLAAIGARLIHARILAVQELEKLAAQVHQDLTRGHEVLRLNYLPAFDPMPVSPMQYALPLDTPVDRSGQSIDQIQHSYKEELARNRADEIQRGATTIGPHRDDLRFLSNGIDLGVFGSRGQCRTAVLALKLAEIAWMKQKTGQLPVLLLYEVLAELDPARRQDLLSRLMGSEQALLTTTDLDLFSQAYIDGARIWRINGGQVEAQPAGDA
jgi:DNA replication and repair protein RecF